MVGVFLLMGSAGAQPAQDSTKTIAFTEHLNNSEVNQEANPAITLELDQVPLKKALKQIAGQANAGLYYNSAFLPEKTVSLRLQAVPLDKALRNVLVGTSLKVITSGRNITLEWKRATAKMQRPLVNIQETINGTVSDGQSGETLPGVNILVKGTTTGASTDQNGDFELTVPSLQDTLVVSFIGYQTKEVPIDGRTEIDVALQPQAIAGEEMVVVGYGTQEKRSLTGSVASVEGSELTKRSSVSNTASLLQGRMPGVQVVQNSSQPGAEGVNIQIRGQGTFSSAGSSPLVLIDGVPGSLSDVSSKEIENISVLKDAASAAMYGARGANGVIMVETKGGQQGEMQIAYEGSFAIQSPTRTLDLITNSAEYMEFFNEAKRNTGLTTGLYPEEEIQKYKNAPKNSTEYPNTDWLDIMIDPAPLQNHNLSFSGGNETTTYRASLNYLNEEGVMRGFNFERINSRIKVSSKIGDIVEFGTNIGLKKSMRQSSSQAAEGQDTYLSTMAQAPTYLPKLPDGRYVHKAYPFEIVNKNTVAVVENKAFNNVTDYNINAQLWGDIQFTDNLNWYLKAAIGGGFEDSEIFRPEVQLYNFKTGNPSSFLVLEGRGLNVNKNRNIYTNLYSYLDYNVSVTHKHNIHAQIGYSQEENTNDYLEGFRRNYVLDNLRVLNAGVPSVQEAYGSIGEWALRSFFGRFNYDYDSRYLVEANLRYDGTSRISPEKRWGVFPSFSAGWRISEEEFFQQSAISSWFNNLKIRASYGQLGNQNIGLYPYQSLLSFTGNYAYTNSELTPGIAQTSLANQNIKWESTSLLDFGLDLFMFDGLEVTFDWYKKRTEDILRASQVTALVGLSAPTINSGEMLNTGIELKIQYNNMVSGGMFDGLQYQAGINFSKYENELVNFGDREIQSYSILQEGEPWDSFYMLETVGIFQSEQGVNNSPPQFSDNTLPGDLKYKNQNGDGVINNDDRVIIDGRHPDFNYSFNLGTQWKRLDVSLFFQGVQGIKYFVDQWGPLPFTQGSPPMTYWRERWTPENPSETLPRLYFGWQAPQRLTRPSTYWLEDGSYLRLKNINVGYTFSSEFINSIGLSSARIYFSGDNLLTFTSYRGLDPERAGSGRFVAYPQNKLYSFGLDIKF